VPAATAEDITLDSNVVSIFGEALTRTLLESGQAIRVSPTTTQVICGPDSFRSRQIGSAHGKECVALRLRLSADLTFFVDRSNNLVANRRRFGKTGTAMHTNSRKRLSVDSTA